MAAGLVP